MSLNQDIARLRAEATRLRSDSEVTQAYFEIAVEALGHALTHERTLDAITRLKDA